MSLQEYMILACVIMKFSELSIEKMNQSHPIQKFYDFYFKRYISNINNTLHVPLMTGKSPFPV